MKIAVMTGTGTKGNMTIDTSHSRANVVSLCQMNYRTLFGYLCLVLLIPGWTLTLEAQVRQRIELRGDVADFRINESALRASNDLNQVFTLLEQTRLKRIEEGYLSCSVDSLTWNDSMISASIFMGQKFEWALLGAGNIPRNLWSQLKYDPVNFLNRPLKQSQVSRLMESVLTYFEENGYPFASVRLDSLRWQEATLSASLLLDKGPLIHIDTIIISDEARVAPHVVLQLLGLHTGMLYSESRLRSISARIRELSYLEEAAPWRLDFNEAETKLSLFLQSKQANRADILIGLLPNNQERKGGVLLTGDVKLAFANALGFGESFAFNWQNLQVQSPRYNLEAELPYVLKTAFGLRGRFDFYKKDSSFKTVQGELSLVYPFKPREQIRLYYELSSTRIVTLNVASLLNTRKLPDLGDARYRTFGMEAQFSRVDYQPNPRRGYRWMLNGAISFRTLLKNTTLENTLDPIRNETFAYLYDSVDLKNYKYTLRAMGAWYTPLQKRFVLATQVQSGYVFSSEPLYRNEVFQIGGYRLLRGFDEGTLFVNGYGVFTLEPRFLLSADSYFFLFSEFAFLHSRYGLIRQNDSPYSLGGGMSFRTRAGMFAINYAVGTRDAQAFQFRNAKIHFGYINYF